MSNLIGFLSSFCRAAKSLRATKSFALPQVQTRASAFEAAQEDEAKSRAEYQDEVEKIMGVKIPKL